MYRFFIFFIFLGFWYNLQATEYNSCNSCNKITLDVSTLEKILLHRELIINCSKEKIYLNPNRIYATDHGLIALSNENEEISIPFMSSDSNGCFINMGILNEREIFNCSQMPSSRQGQCDRNISENIELVGSKPSQSLGPCPGCNVPTDSRGICRNPQCWFYGFQVL